MSKRVQQHEIEDESIIQFQAVLPRKWVFRKEEQDYGIDASFEIFGEDRTTTGLRVFVQLKGTASEKSSIQKRIPFRLKDLEYWQSQSLPVLLIRYCSIGKKIYWAWDFDRRIRISENEKDASLLLGEQDLWNEQTPDEIHLQLENLKCLYDGHVSLPISMQSLDYSKAEDLQLTREMRAKMKQYSSLVSYGNLSNQLHLAVEKTEDEYLLSLQGTATAAIPIEQESSERLAANFIAGAAFCFAAVGQTEIAKRLLKSCFKKADFHCFDDTSFLLSNKLLSVGEFQFIAEIAVDSQMRALNPLGVEFYTFSPLYYSSDSPDNDNTYSGAAMLSYLEICVAAKDGRAGRVAYNCGEFFLSLGARKLALHHFRKAVTLDPSYWDKDYLFVQAGGALFQSERFRASSACYMRAIKIQNRSDPSTIALLGEALLKCGKIGSSLFWLQKALENDELENDPRHATFCLHCWTVDFIRQFTNVSRVKRQTAKAQAIVKAAIQEAGEVAPDILEAAIELDPVDSFLWHAVAVEWRRHEIDGAFEAFIAAAILSDGHAPYWVDLLLSAFQQNLEAQELSIFIAAASIYGFNNLADEVRIRSERADLGDKEALMLEQLGDFFSTFPDVPRPKVARLVPLESEEELSNS